MSDRDARPKPAPKPPSILRGFVTMLWRQALIALVIAGFFGTVVGGGRWRYLVAFEMALVFSYTIGLLTWALGAFVVPRIPDRPGQSPTSAVFRITGLYTLASFVGAAAASYIVHSTVMPGFLGSGKAVAVVAMYTVLFGALTAGIVLAFIFHGDAIQRAKAEQELDLARRIQRAFLISEFPAMPRIEVHAVNISSKQVSGDFYDVVAVGDAVLLAIADVSGKGVAAALMSSMLQASLRTQASSQESVAGMLLNMNRLLCGGAPTGKFATFFLARVHEPTLRLHSSNAGHNHPLLRRRDGTIQELTEGGLLLGIREPIQLAEGSVDLAPGDTLLLYTDGISEAADANNELYREERLTALFRTLPPDLPASETADRVLAAVRTHLNGTEVGDDMTLVVLRVRP